MGLYVFQLSELGEFGLVLKESDKCVFMRRFAEYVKTLLRVKAAEDYSMNSVFWGSVDATGTSACYHAVYSMPDFKADWILLKEMMKFVPDFDLKNLLSDKMKFFDQCRARMKKMSERGFLHFFFHYNHYLAVRRSFNEADQAMTFQDIFSVAVAHFVSSGWGKAYEFKLILNDL